MSDWTEEEIRNLKKLLQKAERDPDFSEEDLENLRKLIDFMRSLELFGRFAKWIVFVLAAIAGAFTAWDQILERLRVWLAG